LLNEKLSCLGCHRIGDQGGKIGPDLSSIQQRLNSVYAFNQIKQPSSVSPNSIMPKITIQERTLELIYHFFFQQDTQTDSAQNISSTEIGPLVFGSSENHEDRYTRLCAACHGRHGDGDGYNAFYLDPAKPTAHSDSEYMSRRPDDTLFDGIYAGGYILNKHHFMPPWGNFLSRDEIQGLVAHIRRLCGCQGPEWSLDDQQRRKFRNKTIQCPGRNIKRNVAIGRRPGRSSRFSPMPLNRWKRARSLKSNRHNRKHLFLKRIKITTR
jgi:mono/diheme cytochrome c family protein